MTKDTNKKELFIGSCSHCATQLGRYRAGWWDAGHMVRQWQRVNEGQGGCNDQAKEGQKCHESVCTSRLT